MSDRPSPLPSVRRAALAPERAPRERWAVRLEFVGAKAVTPRGEAPTPAVVSYFKGADGQSQNGLKTYGSVIYPELWPGIDLVYGGEAGHLKYTFLVKPGADPDQIQLAFRGATAVTLTDTGQLAVATPVGGFTDDRPYAYQENDGRRDEVSSAFALATASADGAQAYGFKVGRYDRRRPLVLDPSVLVYAGYIGGSGDDAASGIAVDAAGNAYVVGTTRSSVPSFPAKVGPDLIFNGGFGDVFVAKVKADGTDLVYLGYIGGAGQDSGAAIAVDKAGNAYVTGFTDSDQATFPVKVGPSLIHSGRSDAFVAKVKADGTGLVYCGYIGGSGFDGGSGIAVDAAGNAYVTGATDSDETGFPVKAGPGLFFNGGDGDAFVAKVKADGTGLLYAGYIGGTGSDEGRAIALDAAGNAYVTGVTDSDQTSFPVKVGPDLNYNLGPQDAFVAKVKADGTTLVYAGYIGGAGADGGIGIAVDTAGNAYVTGFTDSDQTTFPVKVGPDLVFNGSLDAFVAKVKADGTGLLYAGYIGGAGLDIGTGVAVDALGNAYVAGATTSDQTSFPVHVGPDLTFNGETDAFVAKIKPDGTGLLYAGYIGGTGLDFASGIAVDAAGNVYIAGQASSDQTTFPVTVGPDLIFGGGRDAFVAKISGKPDLTETGLIALPIVAKPGGTLTMFDTASNGGLGTAKASTTRYYLSTDTVRSANDILLIGTRVVSSLEPGASLGGSATVTLPTNVPLGSYRVLGCVDDTKVIAELDETNNCLPGNTVQVTLPNLEVTDISKPPLSVQRGHSFSVTDIVQNLGSVSAAATTTRYYLSLDLFKGAGDIALLGSRSVGILQASGTSTGTVTVTVPAGTAPKTYRLLACTDDTNVVKELNENDNCATPNALVTVTP